MSKNSAEYMRLYRARKRLDARTPEKVQADRLAFLEEEVARLKRILANRPGVGPIDMRDLSIDDIPPGFNSRPFTPAPKVTKRHT